MRPNVKEILKDKPYSYKEDDFSTAGVFDEGIVFMTRMNKGLIIETLILYGMNKGFSPKIVSLIKSAVSLRRQLWNKRIASGSGLAKKLTREFESIERGISEIKEALGPISGVRDILLTHIDAIKRQAEELSSPTCVYAYPDLTAVAKDSLKIIEDIRKVVLDVLDQSSVTASKMALTISYDLLLWSDGTMLDAIENGSILNKDAVTEPLTRAKKVAQDWAGLHTGVTDSNPAAPDQFIDEYSDTMNQLAQLLI